MVAGTEASPAVRAGRQRRSSAIGQKRGAAGS
jgi:hypothetical protein